MSFQLPTGARAFNAGIEVLVLIQCNLHRYNLISMILSHNIHNIMISLMIMKKSMNDFIILSVILDIKTN